MENNCTLLVALPDQQALPTSSEVIADLENGKTPTKVNALKRAIQLVLSGEEMPRVLMAVIRFCITSEDHILQKLIMLYYECVKKYDASGKLLPEMILVWYVLLSIP